MHQLARPLVVLLILNACIESTGPTDGDPGPGDPGPCSRPASPADRTRYVVVSHPYDENGDPVGVFEVLELTRGGELSTTGKTFELGYTTDGRIEFTPDGAIGLVAHHSNLGTLGVFRLAADGTPTVVHREYDGDNHDLWVSSVTVHPDGERALVIDGNWQNNGGGIYEVAIACDGTITENRLLVQSKLAEAAYYLPDDPDRIVVVAKEIGPEDALVSDASDDVHLIDISGTPTWIAGADLFPDDDHMVAASTLTWNGRHVLVADGSVWSGLPHRIGVAEITATDILFAQLVSPLPFNNPGGLAASPFNNAALLLTWEGKNDAATWYTYNPDAAEPLGLGTEVIYQTRLGAPLLAGSAAAVIARGSLSGRILINENVKVRLMQFLAAGGVVDVDAIDYGTGAEALVGALGVQP